MLAKNLGDTLKAPRSDHIIGTMGGFFGRLKDEPHSAGKIISPFLQDQGGAQK
jgi:hypothetical protein